MSDKKTGTVYLVGAGPGDPDLITVKGKELLQNCDAVVYDKLIPGELVIALPDRIEKIYVGKKANWHSLPQHQIQELLVKLAKQGKNVVRLKGGDPFIFGRGGEETGYLQEHGVPCQVVPGITSGIAGPLYNGIPCTDRRKSSQVLFVTGHKAREKEVAGVSWQWVAKAKGTIVIYMGVREIDNIVEKLLANGMSPKTPAAIVERGTYPTQRNVCSTLKDLSQKAKTEKIRPPALFVIGEVVDLKQQLDWFAGKPLCGKRIMVTRPGDQALDLYRKLRSLGAEVLACPTIATDENDDAQAWRKFEEISESERWLVFTSENGVRYFMRQFDRYIGDIRALGKFKIAAMGFGTAKALGEFRLRADFLPDKATVANLAAQIESDLNLKGAVVVRVQGNLSDNTVKDTAIHSGARVLPMTVYRTFHPTWPQGIKESLFDYPPDFIMFTSGSTVGGLFAALSEEEVKTLTKNAILVSIGPSTTKKLEARGLVAGIEAKIHNIPTMLEEIEKYVSPFSEISA